jgi:hypothetical protein
MTHLVLISCENVKKNLHSFERFVNAYDLKIISMRENALEGTIEMTISARCHEQAKWLSGLAFDFFGNALTKLQADYSAGALKKAA